MLFNLTTEMFDGLMSKQYTMLYTAVMKYTWVYASITNRELSWLSPFKLLSLGMKDMILHCCGESKFDSSSTVSTVPRRFKYHITRMSALMDLLSSINTYTNEAITLDPGSSDRSGVPYENKSCSSVCSFECNGNKQKIKHVNTKCD